MGQSTASEAMVAFPAADRWPPEYRAKKYAEASRNFHQLIQPYIRMRVDMQINRSYLMHADGTMECQECPTEEQKAHLAQLDELIAMAREACFADFLPGRG